MSESLATVWGWTENVQDKAHRGWLADSGFSAPSEDDMPWGAPGSHSFTWEKLVSVRTHTCRRDHADGRVKKGEKYRVYRHRYIDDHSGKSWHTNTKRVIR